VWEGHPDELAQTLRRDGYVATEPLALVLDGATGCGLATLDRTWLCAMTDKAHIARAIARVEDELAPRWIWWSAATTAKPLVAQGVRLSSCWDLAAVHRLLHGASRDDPATVWAGAAGLDPAEVPAPPDPDPRRSAQLALLGADLSAADHSPPTAQDWPLRADGHLHPACFAEITTPAAAAELARLGAQVQQRQREQLSAGFAARTADPNRSTAFVDPRTTARSESAAALLCVELEQDGLPLDRAEAERLIGQIIGPRPDGEAGRAAERQRRDAVVLQHTPGLRADLRNPLQVRDLLRQVGIDVTDTRSWRLEPFRGVHPVIEPLLAWRKAERIETTYGYTGWIATSGPTAGCAGAGRPATARRPDDGAGRPAQPAVGAARGRRRRARPCLRPGRPRADRASGARGGLGRPGAGAGDR